MANKSSVPQFNLNTQVAIRFAVIGVVAFAVLLLLIAIVPSLFGLYQLGSLIPIAVGYFYAAELGKKATPSYMDAGVGGAAAGAIYAVFAVIALVVLGGVFANLLGGELAGLGFGFASSLIVGNLLNAVITDAILAAIGGAAYVFVKTQKIG